MIARPGGLTAPLVVAAAILIAPGAATQTRVAVEVAATWRFVAGGTIRHAPAVSPDGVIYVASDDRWLRAVDPQGREMWRAPIGARPAAGPVIADDASIIVVTADRAIMVMGAQGRLRWSAVLDHVAAYGPALGGDGELYVALEQGYLARLDHRGQAQWTIRLASPARGPPTVSRDGTVYICTEDRILRALDRRGREVWAAALPGPARTAALGSDGTVYVSVFGIRAYAADGKPRWDFPIPVPTTDPVVSRDERGQDVITVAAQDGRLHRIGQDGERREEIALGGTISSPPAVRADGALVLTTSLGLLRVYPDRPSDEVVWVKTGSQATAPVIAPGGLAVVGSEDWVLTAAGFGDPLPVASGAQADPWAQTRGDGRNTGRAAGPGGVTAGLVLREMAASPLLSSRELVLEDIGAHLAGDRYLAVAVAEMESLLARVAQEIPPGRTADNPALRSRACALLGELGTMGARQTLLAVMERDPRREVQSSAARALGRIGYDADGQAGSALGRLARRYAGDEGFMSVVVRALRDVAAATGAGVGLGDARAEVRGEGLESRPAWAALVSITVGPYPESARRAAREALRWLGVWPRRGDTGVT